MGEGPEEEEPGARIWGSDRHLARATFFPGIESGDGGYGDGRDGAVDGVGMGIYLVLLRYVLSLWLDIP